MHWSEFLAKLPRNLFIVKFSRSGGPGGQNVNKVNSKASIRLPREKLAVAEWISPNVRTKLMDSNFIYSTKRGDLLVTSELTRSQPTNLNDCFEKLAKQIAIAAFVPKETSAKSKERWEQLNKKESAKLKFIKQRHASKKLDRKKVD